MLLNPLSLMGSSYADNSLTWSAQRTLNWLPETAEVEGTRTPIKFADIPGLRAVVDLGTGAPIRGMENVEGKLFAVSGTSLFEISTAFAATNRGNIPGVTRVSMAHNKQGGVASANELVIANGLSGYVYNTATQSLVQITDDAFQGAMTFDYVDGFITFTDPQGRFWGHSALNQATSYSSIDRYDAESAPDPIISHIVSHREVMVFGTRTTEFFRNTGAATGTFQRVDGTELEVGICAPFARARIDNSVCWVGDSLEVFRLEGHAPQRISTRPIEQMLHTVNPANVFSFAWEDRGHKVFYITAPEAFTLGFDFASGMWHERQTFDLPRWRANALVAWNGFWIVGDYTNGLLYVLDWDTHTENGLELIRERASGYTHGGQNKVLAPYVELLFDTGTEGPAPPQISGDVPGGFVGDATSGAYLVTGGVEPYGPVMVLSGTFPPGLTLDTDGTWSGTYTEPGSYAWTVGGFDAAGSPFSVADTAQIIAVDWWLKPPNTVGLTDKAYINTPPSAFSTQVTRSPASDNSGLGPVQADAIDGRVIWFSATQAELIDDLNAAGGITVASVVAHGSITPSMARCIDGVWFLMNDGLTYRYSTDNGATWQTFNMGTHIVYDIARLDNGRWIMYAYNGGTGEDAFYSDDAVPASWTLAHSFGAVTNINSRIACNGTLACILLGPDIVGTTTDGLTWGQSSFPAISGQMADIRGAVAIGDVFMFSGQHNSGNNKIIRSADAGASWAVVNMPNADLVATSSIRFFGDYVFVGGLVSVLGTQTYGAFYSDDQGATFQGVSLPVAVAPNQSWAAHPVRRST